MSQLQATPLAGPREQACVPVPLPDGAVAELRPLGSGETALVLSVFDGMSEGSRALRYLRGLSRLPASMLSMLSDVDDDQHVAWVAMIAGEPAGIARYARIPGCTATAEVAFEVVDRHHGRGLATALLDAVTTVAAARGVRRVRATMARSNGPSQRLLERVGATSRLVDDLVEAEGALQLLAPSAIDRSAVLGLAFSDCFDPSFDAG